MFLQIVLCLFSKTGVVDLICKEDGIICGLQIFERTFELLDEACDVNSLQVMATM